MKTDVPSVHVVLTCISNIIVDTSIQLEELLSQRSRDHISAKREAVLEWLSPLDPSSQHNTASSLKEPDTGEWFFKRQEFQTWRDGDDGILFCHGMPGSGKTVLTSTVIHHFHQAAHMDSVCVAYFYCNHQLLPQLELHELILCLVKQMVRQCLGLPLAIESMFDLYKDVLFRPSIADTNFLLNSAIACFKKTYIFVDAIDEFMSRERSLDDGVQILDSLTECLTNNDVKLYFTSRLAPHHYMWKKPDLKIQAIEIRAPAIDTILFLKRREHRFPNFVQGRAELQKRIQEVVLEKASGQ